MRGSRFYGFGLNRTLCDVLKEMREFSKYTMEDKHRRVLMSLVEEAQTMGNRMEAKLFDNSEMDSAIEHKEKLKKEIKELEEKHERLSGENETDDDN